MVWLGNDFCNVCMCLSCFLELPRTPMTTLGFLVLCFCSNSSINFCMCCESSVVIVVLAMNIVGVYVSGLIVICFCVSGLVVGCVRGTYV